MRKIKRFVLNDSFTVLSAEAQKKVLGGDSQFIDGCSSNPSTMCSGFCLVDYSYTIPGSGGVGNPDQSSGWTKEGYCVWNTAAQSCVCVTD